MVAESVSPQSNQRGIETPVTCGARNARPQSLNRTSVGLKHDLAHRLPDAGDGPQSNQRGIETSILPWRNMQLRSRLNRTSVGLKRRIRASPSWAWRRLNRTSVGLKPPGRQAGQGDGVQASIEPAWD